MLLVAVSNFWPERLAVGYMLSVYTIIAIVDFFLKSNFEDFRFLMFPAKQKYISKLPDTASSLHDYGTHTK